MQDSLGTWMIRATSISVTAATQKTALQYVASSTNTAEVLYMSISQNGSTTSAMEQVKILRKSAAATVTTGVTGTSVLDYSAGAGTFRGTLSTTGTGVNATGEGTDADIYHLIDFNTLAGYEWVAQPNGRIWVPTSGILAVKITAIITATWNVQLLIAEEK